jgi:hypothetical protein
MQDNFHPKPNIAPITRVLETIFRDMKKETLQDIALDLDDIDCACKIISHNINLIRTSRGLNKEKCLQLITAVEIWITFEIDECHMPGVKSFLKRAFGDTPKKRGKMEQPLGSEQSGVRR